MRVKISYGVDIKDVPNKVSDLVTQSLDEIKLVINDLQRSLIELEEGEKSVSQALISLDRSRIKLGNIDSTLQDAQSIVSGLEEYYNGEQNVSEGRPVMDPSGNITT